MTNVKTKVLSFGICNLLLFCHLCFVICHSAAAGEDATPYPALLGPDTAAKESTPASQSDITWVDGKLPPAATEKGDWVWDEDNKQDGIISHTYGQKAALYKQSFTTDSIVEVTKDSSLLQHAFLDPNDSPKGIMIKMITTGEKPITLYWEGEEEVFADSDDYLTAWYMGLMPESGKWVLLEIDFKELDVVKEELKGLEFIAFGAKVWWGKTIIKGARYVEKEEEGQAELAVKKSE